MVTPLRGTVGPLSTISTPLRGTDVTSSVNIGLMSVGLFIMLLAMGPTTLGGPISILLTGPLLQSSLRHLICSWGAVVELGLGKTVAVVAVTADGDDVVDASC